MFYKVAWKFLTLFYVQIVASNIRKQELINSNLRNFFTFGQHANTKY